LTDAKHYKSEMKGCSAGRESDDMFPLSQVAFEVSLKSVDIRAERRNPIVFESLFNVLHLVATHVGHA
jgi:hypothetical protein